MITGISGLGFLVQKWPFRDAHLFFKKCFAETPIFIVFLGACFLGEVVKKGNFGHPPKNEKLTDNWKAHFLVSLCFFCFFFFCFLLVFCFVGFFVWGFKGQARWPFGPNPPFFWGGGLFFSFLSLLLLAKPVSPLNKEKHFLFISECLPLLLLSLFGLPLVQFLFLCLSLSLSLSLSYSFLSSFLSFFCFLLVPSFCLFLSFFFAFD